jgi:hypothetical protein
MGQFLQVNGDYNIKTAVDGVRDGVITLDTGTNGKVIVTGNLEVKGNTVSINTTVLDIEDNIIVLNKNETGNGVSLRYSGIEIERGSANNAFFILDDQDPENPVWNIATGQVDTPLNYSTSNIKLRKILTDPDTDNGDLTLGNGAGIVKVKGFDPLTETNNYTNEIVNRISALDPTVDDILANKGYVDLAILNNPSFQIFAPQNQDTKVIIADKDITPNISSQFGSLEYYNNQYPGYEVTESMVSIAVDGEISSRFFSDRLEVENLIIKDNSISAIADTNVLIKTLGTGNLQTNRAIQLDHIGINPATVVGSAILYSAGPSIGTTGLFYVNADNSGELISKHKALLFSMIF